MVLPNPAAASSAESSSACWALMVRAVVTELSKVEQVRRRVGVDVAQSRQLLNVVARLRHPQLGSSERCW